MIKSLRKRHLQIWILWAVLLPAGIFIAWMAVPEKATQELLQQSQVESGKIAIARVQKNNYDIQINSDPVLENSKLYLEFGNKKNLSNSSLLIYQIVDPNEINIDKQLLLGRIDERKVQVFPLEFNSSNWVVRYNYGYNAKFVLYDFIRKETIDTIFIKTDPLVSPDYSNF